MNHTPHEVMRVSAIFNQKKWKKFVTITWHTRDGTSLTLRKCRRAGRCWKSSAGAAGRWSRWASAQRWYIRRTGGRDTPFYAPFPAMPKSFPSITQKSTWQNASWGTAKDIEPYVDPVFENNVLLTETERLMMSGRPKQPKYARNKNILVIGGSGSGKTRFFVKPNLMQMHSSYVVTDPKG